MLEAAADAGLDVGPSKGGHLAQLPWDLDGFVEQEAQLSLVARVPGRCYLAEKVWTGRIDQMKMRAKEGLRISYNTCINIVKNGRKGDIYYHIGFFLYISFYNSLSPIPNVCHILPNWT